MPTVLLLPWSSTPAEYALSRQNAAIRDQITRSVHGRVHELTAYSGLMTSADGKGEARPTRQHPRPW